MAERSRFEFDSSMPAGTQLHEHAGEVMREFSAHRPPVKHRSSNTKRRAMLCTAIALAFQSVSQAWDGQAPPPESHDFTLADTRDARNAANADKGFERFAKAVGAEAVVTALNGQGASQVRGVAAVAAPRPSPAADGLTLIAQQRYIDAEQWFATARQTKPRNVDLLLGHARAMMHNNRVASAGALLDLAVEIEPANVEAICLRARWHARSDLLRAIAQLRDCQVADDAKVVSLRLELTARTQRRSP